MADGVANLRQRAAAWLKRGGGLTKRQALAAAYQEIFATPAGKLVLNDLLREGGVLEVSYVPGDDAGTHFNDGKRALALHVLHRLRWAPGELATLAQERTEEQLAEMQGEAA